MQEGAYIIAGIIVIYLLTLISWYVSGNNKRLRKIILLVNLCIVVFYTLLTAVIGDDECGIETWFCFKWYDYAILFLIFHLILFWSFMILQLIIEVIIKYVHNR